MESRISRTCCPLNGPRPPAGSRRKNASGWIQESWWSRNELRPQKPRLPSASQRGCRDEVQPFSRTHLQVSLTSGNTQLVARQLPCTLLTTTVQPCVPRGLLTTFCVLCVCHTSLICKPTPQTGYPEGLPANPPIAVNPFVVSPFPSPIRESHDPSTLSRR